MNKLLLLLGLMFAFSVQAAYITDRLVAPVYEKPDSTLEPLQVLTSGAPVEVLKKQKGYVQIRFSAGETGWLEGRYLSDEKPARMLLLDAQAKLRTLKAEQAEGNMAAESVNLHLPSVAEARLQRELDAANQQIAELQAQVLELPKALQDREALEELKAQVADAVRLLGGQPSLEQADAAEDSPWMGYLPWLFSLITLALGIALGVIMIDYRIRKKYGGFRI